MKNNFSLINKIYEASKNLHSLQDSFKLVRYIDGDLSSYTKNALQLSIKKSGNLIPTKLDEVLGFHSSLRSQIILDPFSRQRHLELYKEVSKIDLRDLVGPVDLSLLQTMAKQAEILLHREQVPGLDFLSNIIKQFDEELLITFRRESTIAAAKTFFSKVETNNLLFDSLHQRHEEFVENNLIFGPIHWFQESIISNPRGSHLLAIMPAHLKFNQPDMTSYPDWFNFGKSPLFRDLDSSLLVLNNGQTEDLNDIEYSIPIRWITENSSSEKVNENQKLCRQLALANGKQVFIDIDSDQDFVHSIEILNTGFVNKIEINPRDLKIGDYIILREGQSDMEALYMKARELIGPKIGQIEQHQHEWKSALKNLILREDLRSLNRALKDRGMKSVNRLSDWTNPSLRRPLRDDDFTIILDYLGLDVNKYLTSASVLKRAILQVAVNFRLQLIDAIKKLDGSSLKHSGTYVISSPVDGIADLFISKIIGVSPQNIYVDSQRVRVPFDQIGNK